MRALICTSLLASRALRPRQRPFEVYDTRLAGFTLRIQPSGVRAYYARVGRTRQIALGKARALSPDDARNQCQRILGNVAAGRYPTEGLGGDAGMTLEQFLVEIYEPWAAPEISALIEVAESVCDLESRESPVLTLVRPGGECVSA